MEITFTPWPRDAKHKKLLKEVLGRASRNPDEWDEIQRVMYSDLILHIVKQLPLDCPIDIVNSLYTEANKMKDGE